MNKHSSPVLVHISNFHASIDHSMGAVVARYIFSYNLVIDVFLVVAESGYLYHWSNVQERFLSMKITSAAALIFCFFKKRTL